MSVELDDRWDWAEVTTMGAAGPEYLRGSCRHINLTPVTISNGEQVARLCLTCDAQLPPC